jgi:hypothetical protein
LRERGFSFWYPRDHLRAIIIRSVFVFVILNRHPPPLLESPVQDHRVSGSSPLKGVYSTA